MSSEREALALVALRHVKRARGLLREASRQLARTGDLDTVAHTTVRTTAEADQLRELLAVALTEHRELDVIVIAATPTPQPTVAQETP